LQTKPTTQEVEVGRIVVSEFVSLDGVMQDPGGTGEFKHGGWSFEVSRGDEGDKFKLDETMQSEALLLGRTTYEGFAAAWPQMKDDVGFADRFNSMPKYVVSSTLKDPEWTGSKVISLDDVPEIKAQTGGDLVVHGSAQLFQGLFARDLVDELRLMVYPVVLGSGKRLFGESDEKKPLKLASTQTVGDGVVILVYTKP
jgi:dihydrofolate reductase